MARLLPVNESKHNIMEKFFEDFDQLTITLKGGKELKGFYACWRVSDNDVPKGYYRYDIRHSDIDDSIMATLEKVVCVNHHGTFITAEKVVNKDGNELSGNDYLEIEDWNFDPWCTINDSPRQFIPCLDTLYEKTKEFVKNHQGEKGYIDTQDERLDTITAIVYDGEYGYASENKVHGVRVNPESDDLEICYEPIMVTYKVEYRDEDFKSAEWETVRNGDCVNYIPTIFAIAESIEEYI